MNYKFPAPQDQTYSSVSPPRLAALTVLLLSPSPLDLGSSFRFRVFFPCFSPPRPVHPFLFPATDGLKGASLGQSIPVLFSPPPQRLPSRFDLLIRHFLSHRSDPFDGFLFSTNFGTFPFAPLFFLWFSAWKKFFFFFRRGGVCMPETPPLQGLSRLCTFLSSSIAPTSSSAIL